MTKKRLKTILKYVLSFGLAALLLWISFKGIDWKTFWADLQITRWGHVFLFVPFAVGALVFRMLFWHSMLAPLNPQVGYGRVWHANNMGNLANAVVPMAGDFVRCGYLTSSKIGYDSLLGTVAMERVFDAVSISLIFISALLFDNGRFAQFFRDNIFNPISQSLGQTAWILIILILLSVAGFIVLSFKLRKRRAVFGKIADFMEGIGRGFSSVAKMRNKWAFIAYTLCLWACYVFMYFFIIQSIPALSHLGITDALFLTAIGNLASVVPVPGGVGAYHYLIALAISTVYGASWESGILFATLQHELHAVLLIALGLWSYFRLTLKRVSPPNKSNIR